MAGLFFCLASTRCRAFIFARERISHAQAFTAVFLPSMQNYTDTTPKPFTGLYSGISVDLTYSNERNTAATQAAYTNRHPAGWHTVKRRPSTDTRDTTATPDAVQVSTAAYYNKVYKRSANHASPAGSAPAVCGSLASADTLPAVQTRRTPPGGTVQRWAARNH